MAIFASTTLGSSDPSRAMSIKALETRAQALAAAQAKQEIPQSMPSPWQGAGYLANTVADAWATKRADQQAAQQRQELANLQSQIGPEGPNAQQKAGITARDPELGRMYETQAFTARQNAADIQARKEAAAEAVRAQEAAAVANEARVANRPKSDIGIINTEASQGKMSEEERVAGVKKFTAPPVGEQKYTDEMQEKSVAGQALLSSLDEALALANHPKGIHAGPQAGTTQTIGENMPGIVQKTIPGLTPDPKTTENTQRYNQIMGEQALDLLTKMKGASSDRDVKINFDIVNNPNATLDNKKIALRKMRDRIATLLQLHNEDIARMGGKVPTLQHSEGPAAPAAAAGPAAAADPAAAQAAIDGGAPFEAVAARFKSKGGDPAVLKPKGP